MSKRIFFASTCPCCRRERIQDHYSLAALRRLLNGGYPIEAYCAICDEFWPVNPQKRVELGEVVVASGGGETPRDGDLPSHKRPLVAPTAE